MCPLNLFLFGSPHLEKDGSTLKFGRRKSLALLDYLAVNPHPHSRDSLAGYFG
jgi:DNA-binding SARP family transcriptional activator